MACHALDRAIDKTWGEGNRRFYLNNPEMYGLFDPMGELGKAIATRSGREAAIDLENVEENLLRIN